MNEIKRCPGCQKTIGKDTGTEWLRVELQSRKQRRFLLVKEYKCECGYPVMYTEEELIVKGIE